jgi:hypothetical protein
MVASSMSTARAVPRSSPPDARCLLPRLDKLEAAMRRALVPDLRAGERSRTDAERRAQHQANARRARIWLDALAK